MLCFFNSFLEWKSKNFSGKWQGLRPIHFTISTLKKRLITLYLSSIYLKHASMQHNPTLLNSAIKDVQFGENVKIVQPVNIYGCKIGNNTFGRFCATSDKDY